MGGLRIWVGLLGALAWGLACGGIPGEQPHENSAACDRYRSAVDALACAGAVLDPRDCPAALDDEPCDYSAYYACLVAGLKCADGALDVSAQIACTLVCE